MLKYFFSFIFAIALHLGILWLFFINIPMQETKIAEPEEIPDIIEATILDETVIEQKAQALQKIEEAKKRAQQQKQANIARQLAEEKQRVQEAKLQRLAEELKAKQQAEQRKIAALAEQKKLQEVQQQVALEKKKQQELKMQRLAEEKKQAEEQKRKAEAERVAQEQRKQEEAKKEAARKEAEKQAKKIAEQKQRENEEKLRAAIAQEAENAEKAKQASVHAAALIRQKVTQSWNRPGFMAANLECKLRIGLVPGGDVVSVTIAESSGSALFDDSAVRAVYKASPLPVPKDPSIFQNFRNFSFVFAPN